MDKQEWKSIKFEVIKFTVEDVIATSGDSNVEGVEPNPNGNLGGDE